MCCGINTHVDISNFTRRVNNFTRYVITSPVVSEYWCQKYLLGEFGTCSLDTGAGLGLVSSKVIQFILVSQFSLRQRSTARGCSLFDLTSFFIGLASGPWGLTVPGQHTLLLVSQLAQNDRAS